MNRQKSFTKELGDVLSAGVLVGTFTHVAMNFDRYFYLKYSEIGSLENLRNYAIITTSLVLVGIVGKTYDGTFTRTLIDGDGVTVALLKRNGIRVYSEKEF